MTTIETLNRVVLGDYEPVLEWWWTEDVATKEGFWLERWQVPDGAKVGDILIVKGVETRRYAGRSQGWEATEVVKETQL